MLESYFFIPGDKQKYIDKSLEINASFFVFDLEDSVSVKNKSIGLKNLLRIKANKKNYFVRAPLFENIYSKEEKRVLINHFNGNLVVPKVDNIEDIDRLVDLEKLNVKLNLILLIETPKGFVNTKSILDKYSSIISGIGFGSHDFSSITRIKHTSKNLDFYRKQLTVFAKAYDVKYIDSVDLNLKDFTQFEEECLHAFNQGADGKFIIHPEQLRLFNSLNYYSENELEFLKKVYLEMVSQKDEDFDILKIDGRIFERPHLLAIKRIFEKK